MKTGILMSMALALAALASQSASAACVFRCETPDCSWEKVMPASCIEAEPFHTEEKWKVYADGLKAGDASLAQALAALRSLHFSCARARRDRMRWDCGRVLKMGEQCAEHTTVTIGEVVAPGRRPRAADPDPEASPFAPLANDSRMGEMHTYFIGNCAG